MMPKSLKIILFLLCCLYGCLNAQSVESLRLYYERFDYQAVVDQARALLQQRQSLDSAVVKEVLLLSAMSHYSLLNVDAAMVDFLELLRLDPQAELDPTKTSPKIMQFFTEIKQRGFREAAKEQIVIQKDTVRIMQDVGQPMASALKRSLLWPGWGHCYLSDRTRGRLLRGASVLSLAAAIYATIDCRDKEKAYLNTSASSLMDPYYEKYNQAYKRRTMAWGAFTAVWLYSQIDLLYFHPIPSHSTRLSMQVEPLQLSLCYRFSL